MTFGKSTLGFKLSRSFFSENLTTGSLGLENIKQFLFASLEKKASSSFKNLAFQHFLRKVDYCRKTSFQN